jgi:ubiquitin carboxyl-terminal hydrolase 22/27/51
MGEIPRIIQEPDNQAVDLNTQVFSAHCIGVKGLYNLGNTCFMNSVLQPLLHIPALVKFFLADISTPAHPKFTCATSKHEAKSCVACEVDSLFSRMYNGKKKPFCPSDLLYSVWKSSAEMAGYEQQDAHEFLICLRTCLHQSLGGQQFNCNCIIHQLFAGVLQSDVICTMCGKKTETYDPFLDLSLDITPESTSLSGCLQNFTKSEIIPVDVYRCEGCGQVASEFSKRMSIRVAPKTLVVHLKRFEHGAQSRFKIDKHVDFPTSISISSFMTEINEPEEANFSMEDVNLQDSSLYRLMGVVAHVGGLDSGHYTSFVKYRKDWFFIDDAHVSLATEDKVLGSQAYMLFYSS